jgi:hypothetical protein
MKVSLLALLILLAASCAYRPTLQTAEIAEDYKFRPTLSLTYMVPDAHQEDGIPVPTILIRKKTEDSAEYSIATNGVGLTLTRKYQLVGSANDSGLKLSSGFLAGFTVGTEITKKLAHTPPGAGLWEVGLPIYASYRFNDEFSLYSSARAIIDNYDTPRWQLIQAYTFGTEIEFHQQQIALLFEVTRTKCVVGYYHTAGTIGVRFD